MPKYVHNIRYRHYADKDRSRERLIAQQIAEAIARYDGPITVCPRTRNARKNQSLVGKRTSPRSIRAKRSWTMRCKGIVRY